MTDPEIKISVCMQIINREIERLTKFDPVQIAEYVNKYLLLSNKKDYEIIKHQYILDAVIVEKFKINKIH